MIYKYSKDDQTFFLDAEKQMIHAIVYREKFKKKCRSSFTFKETRNAIEWEREKFPGEPIEALPAYPFLKFEQGESGEEIFREDMEAILTSFPEYDSEFRKLYP